MATSGNTYGAIQRYEPARESPAAALAIVLLTILEIIFVTLFSYGLVAGWGTDQTGNMFLGFLLAMIFIDLSFVLLLYRKEFLPDVVIVKKRRRKWEDLNVREEDAEGSSLFGGMWDRLKVVLYPYQKR